MSERETGSVAGITDVHLMPEQTSDQRVHTLDGHHCWCGPWVLTDCEKGTRTVRHVAEKSGGNHGE